MSLDRLNGKTRKGTFFRVLSGKLTVSPSISSTNCGHAIKGEALKMAKTEHKIVNEFLGHLSENDWNPDVFTDLCASALKTKNQDLELYEFCSDLSGKEWKILLEYCNETTNPVNQV